MRRTGTVVALLLSIFFLTACTANGYSGRSESKTETKASAFEAVPLPLPAAVNDTLLMSPDFLLAGSASDPGASADPSAADPDDSLRPSSVEWGPLLKDSFRFLLLEHAYRMTQANTRAGFTGPFFQDYFNSVANIHGWRDGDKFGTNYVGHPMQGAISGDMWIAHDPHYRRTTFDLTSSRYWKSRLRATAFAAAYSLQFEIGPLSEASTGNVQQNPKATGVVDWVITPAVGLAWMVGEDAVDAKLISKWEARTDSRATRIMLRGLLNPSRSFSNILMLKAPWHRDTRPGIAQF